ncbi:MFS transporter [Vagococcus entomophilus]|nr:MFS transporter [Vagococcus entomophilus]
MEQKKGAEITSRLVLLMSIANGVVVANLYYAQPLLILISRYFGISTTNASVIATFTQLGYATGIITLLPLADVMDKKKLIVRLFIPCLLAIAGVYFSTSFVLTCICSFLLGMTSMTPQLLLTLAIQNSDPEKRGKNIGSLLSGLLMGILLSRVASGILGNYFGWKAIYAVAFVLLFSLMIGLMKYLPHSFATADVSYKAAMSSLPRIFLKEKLVQKISLIGCMSFFAMSTFWTCLTFYLADVYHFSSGVTGLFGLIGLSGAFASKITGNSIDRHGPYSPMKVALGLVVGAYLLFLGGAQELVFLILGIIVLDLGVQSCNVSCQSVIQQFPNAIKGRVTAIYMFCFFLGGSLGSFLGTSVYQNYGWGMVCIMGLVSQIIAVLTFVTIHKQKKEKR